MLLKIKPIYHLAQMKTIVWVIGVNVVSKIVASAHWPIGADDKYYHLIMILYNSCCNALLCRNLQRDVTLAQGCDPRSGQQFMWMGKVRRKETADLLKKNVFNHALVVPKESFYCPISIVLQSCQCNRTKAVRMVGTANLADSSNWSLFNWAVLCP